MDFVGASGDNVYLKVQGGALQYKSDGVSAYAPVLDYSTSNDGTPFLVSGATINFASQGAIGSPGTLYLAGMDQGGGTYTTTGAVVVSGNLTTLGNDLSITGGTITVGSSTQPVTIATSLTTGTAGSLTLTAPTIDVDASSQLQALGSSSSANGSITLTASDVVTDQTSLTISNQVADFFDNNFIAQISIGQNAVIQGGDVSLTATSGDESRDMTATTGANAANSIFSLLGDYVNQWGSLPLSVLVTQATATTEVGQGASISSSSSVTISGTATADSTGEAAYWEKSLLGAFAGSFSFAKAESDAEALVDASATITASGAVAVESQTTTTTSGTALVTQNTGLFPAKPDNIQLAGAYNSLTTTSHATVAQGASITTQGSVTVSAQGTDNNDINVQTASYKDGRVGLTGAGSDVNADVKAYVDGTITAGKGNSGSTETINPFLSTTFTAGNSNLSADNQVDYADSRFVFNTNPGYTTGEPLLYSSGMGGPILGLTTNTTYYAIVPSNDSTAPFYVQLATTAANAKAGTFISFAQYPMLDGLPITDVDSSANSEILYDFNPGFTEGETVSFTATAGQFLGYDNSSGSLVGPLSGTYTVHIVNSTLDSTDLYTIQLENANGQVVQLDDSPYFTTASGRVLRIQTFEQIADQVVLNPADLTSGFSLNNGDTLTYHAGLATAVSGLTDDTTYYAIVDPSEFTTIDPTSPPTVQLALTLNDAESGNPVTQYPTFTWNDSNNISQTTTIEDVQTALTDELIGATQSFTITNSDPSTNVLTVSEIAGSSIAPLTVGEMLTYQGAIGSSGTLQDDQIYSVQQIITQSDTSAIQLVLQDTLRLATLGTLTETAGAGQSFSIDSTDPSGNVVTMELNGDGTFTPLTEGETLTYAGAAQSGFLQNGQTYLTHIVQQESSSLVQVELTPYYYVTPSGTLLDAANHSFTILSSNPDTQTLTLSGPAVRDPDERRNTDLPGTGHRHGGLFAERPAIHGRERQFEWSKHFRVRSWCRPATRWGRRASWREAVNHPRAPTARPRTASRSRSPAAIPRLACLPLPSNPSRKSPR